MVDWNNLQTIALESLAMVKAVHFIFGVYIWDWLMSLPTEYRLITRRHELRSQLTMSVYFGCRFFAFATIIAVMAIFNVTTPVNCDAFTRVNSALPYTSLILSSVIVGLRTIAIWRRHKVAVILTVALLSTSAAFLIRGVFIGPHASWDPTSQACGLETHTETMEAVVAASFAVDFALIIMMLVGLWTYKGSGNLWQLIYHQGIIWAIAALLCYIPSVVLLALNFNAPMNLVAVTPTTISMILCTTTMQRRLFEYSMSTNTNLQLLPHAALRRDVKLDGRPASASNSSLAGSRVTMPKPAFIAMDDVGRPVLNIRDQDDSAGKYPSTIV